MAEAALAAAVLPVKDHIVAMLRTGTDRHRVKMKFVAHLSDDDVVSA